MACQIKFYASFIVHSRGELKLLGKMVYTILHSSEDIFICEVSTLLTSQINRFRLDSFSPATYTKQLG